MAIAPRDRCTLSLWLRLGSNSLGFIFLSIPISLALALSCWNPLLTCRICSMGLIWWACVEHWLQLADFFSHDFLHFLRQNHMMKTMRIVVIPVQIQTFFSRVFAFFDKNKCKKVWIRAHRSLPGPRGHDSVGWDELSNILKHKNLNISWLKWTKFKNCINSIIISSIVTMWQ